MSSNSIEAAKFIIAQLQKEYKREFNKAAVQKIFPDLVKEPHKAMEAAFDHFILNSAYLPSPAQLLAKVQAEGKRIRMEETKEREESWKKQKGEDQNGRVDGPTILSKAQHTEFARNAHTVLMTVVERGNCQDAVDGCMMMANMYPHVGDGYRETRRFILERMNRSREEIDNAA